MTARHGPDLRDALLLVALLENRCQQIHRRGDEETRAVTRELRELLEEIREFLITESGH